jgi:sarcosine oxidase, subunit gamma
MILDKRRLSPLSHRANQSADDGAATLSEKPFEGKLILRANGNKSLDAIAAILQQPLPLIAGGTALGPHAHVQWLGPDEWLLLTQPGHETGLASDLGAALAGHHHQLVDVTDSYTTISLSGVRARDMLMKITTIDFHPRAFSLGQGVTSNFGRVIAFVRQVVDDKDASGPCFDLVVRASMADYLWCLLCEAGHEWGLIELDPRGMVRQHLPHWEERP